MVLEVASSHRDEGWRFAAYEVPALVILILLCWMTVASLLHPGLLALTHSPVLAGAISTASLLVALAAAYVALAEFFLYGVVSSGCIGLGFLVFAGGHVGLKLIPLLAGWTYRTSTIFFDWGLQDAIAGILLVIAGVLVGRTVPVMRRTRVVAIGLTVAVLLTLCVSLWAYRGGADVSKGWRSVGPLCAGVLFMASSVLFWVRSKSLHRAWFFWLSLSLVFAGFAEFQYAVAQYPVTVVQPGDVLRLVFFTSILLALAGEWSQDYRRLRWQARELSALHALTTAPGIHQVPTVIQHIERVAQTTLQGHAHVRLLQRRSAEIEDLNGSAQNLDVGDAAVFGPHWKILNGLSVDDMFSGRLEIGVSLGTPDRALGILMVTRDTGEEFSARDLRLLGTFGSQASILLERSLLYEEIAAGAVLQERNRLAREIHDGLAQHLASLKMRVAWLQRSEAVVRVDELRSMEGVLETALIEARHAIGTLRMVPHGSSTVEAIARYAEEFGQVSDLEVSMKSDDGNIEVGPKTRVELFRVVQEALNNVRKHAQASRVSIDVRSDAQGIKIIVVDDGTGFDLGQNEPGHFGLEIMRERAESVGGRLTVSSTVGRGTEVSVWMPVREPDFQPA